MAGLPAPSPAGLRLSSAPLNEKCFVGSESVAEKAQERAEESLAACCLRDLSRPPVARGCWVPRAVAPRYTAHFQYYPTDLRSGAGAEAVPALSSLELLSKNARKCSPKCHKTRPSLRRLGSCTNRPVGSAELRRPAYALLA